MDLPCVTRGAGLLWLLTAKDCRHRMRRTAANRTAAPASEAAHSRAYTVLKEAALAGRFRPGETVTLRSLSAELSLGEMPVREALRRLTAEGAFEALPNRSARVPLLNRRQVEQILELRVLLESRAAALAARNISLGQIESLRALQQEMAQGIERNEARAHAARNLAFHFEIHRIADNPVLSALIETLWLRLAPLLESTLPLVAGKPALFRRVGWSHHEQLLTAFQARDPVGAEEAMRLDILAPTQLPGYWDGLSLPPG